MGRRDFLRVGAGTAIGAGAMLGSSPIAIAGGHTTRRRMFPARARNVIFMVSDGMSTGTLTLCDTVMRMTQGRASSWCSMWEKPGVKRIMQATHSADSFVTDSAASAAAWGCGHACNNLVLNITPDGRQQLPILVHARQSGRATGLVTTARITHATPAGFSATVPNRDLEAGIAQQQLERGIDVLMGGGLAHFKPELLAKHPEWKVVTSKDELAAAGDQLRLLGLFASGHVPHVLDRKPTVPALEDMTRAALARLERAPEGFAVQIEGGRIDHAAHDNDAPSLIQEQMEFDRTLGVVLQWMEGRDDTLLIVTTDHGNANPGLTVYGKRGEDGLGKLLKASHSFEWFFSQVRRLPKDLSDEDRMLKTGDLVEQATGIKLDSEATGLLSNSMRSQRVMPFRDANSTTCVLGSLLASIFGVAFLSPNHTSDMVELTAIGPGADLLRPVMRNREVWEVLVKAMELAPAVMLEGMDELIIKQPSGGGD